MIIAFGRGFRLTELKKPPSDKRYGITRAIHKIRFFYTLHAQVVFHG